MKANENTGATFVSRIEGQKARLTALHRLEKLQEKMNKEAEANQKKDDDLKARFEKLKGMTKW